MIPRYSRPVMKKIWDEENKFKIWFEIEAHAADGMASNGTIPKEAAKKINSKQGTSHNEKNLGRRMEIEIDPKDSKRGSKKNMGIRKI